MRVVNLEFTDSPAGTEVQQLGSIQIRRSDGLRANLPVGSPATHTGLSAARVTMPASGTLATTLHARF